MIELQYYLSNVPEALIYGLLAMGIYISLRILDIPDLTTEGSFGFGAVISVLVALNGHPILALFAGITAYDMQKSLQLYNYASSNPEMLEKLSIYGAFNLYLDFVNIFLDILQLLGDNK